MVDYPDIINFTHEELVEEFCKIFDRYQDLRELSDADKQKIHELKRSLDTATAAQAYLSQELEQYANSDNKETESELLKTRSELQEVKKKCSKLEASLANLQQDYYTLLEENSKITKNLEESKKSNLQLPSEQDGNILDDYLLRIQMLEDENMGLLQKIEDFEDIAVNYTLTIAECEKNIEILTDQITCLEENLQFKRSDLEEKLQILESTQDQLAEANAKISMLSSAPDNNDRKGNSLFAEVDDQRQAMKQLLTAQKKSYLQMKKIYNESEHEIRRLKRENISMRTEFEACSAIFCNADKIYQEKLNERIRNLLYQNDELERKLKWTQERLNDLALNKGILFFDSMLNFCKKETDELKSQLHRVRLQNASLEEQLRNSQQDMARWRFESLKSRCILIDRENLLTENKIAFKPMQAVEFKITEKDQKEAKPRIVTTRRSSIFDTLTNRKSITPSKVPTKQEINTSQHNVTKENEVLNVPSIKIELVDASSDQNSIPCKNEDPFSSHINLEKNKTLNNSISAEQYNSDKENSVVCLDDTPILDNFAKLRAKPPTPPSPMRPSQNSLLKLTLKSPETPVRSILTKTDLLINTCKNVKFSSDGDTVYNLSPDNNSSVCSTKTVKADSDAAPNNTSSKKTMKQSGTKSNIVVRRVVVSSKHD